MSKDVYRSGNAVITETADTWVFHDPHSADCVVLERPEFLRALRAVFQSLTIEEQTEVTGRTETR